MRWLIYEGNYPTVGMSDGKKLTNFHCSLYCCLLLTATKWSRCCNKYHLVKYKIQSFDAGHERLLKDTDYPI